LDAVGDWASASMSSSTPDLHKKARQWECNDFKPGNPMHRCMKLELDCLDTIVQMDHPETGVNLTYISQTGSTGDAGDKYVGLDRFGRVVDQNWYDTATSSSTDDFHYGYDRNFNVLYMNNTVSTGNSELYGYNGLSELTSFERGTLNGTDNGISGTPSLNETRLLDALGYWRQAS
jgi:hypothetical protein